MAFVYTNLNTESNAADQVIEGARSTYLEFRIASSIDLRQSNFLFTRLGGTATVAQKTGTGTVKIIDTLVKVTGLNTGYSVDLPVRFAKL